MVGHEPLIAMRLKGRIPARGVVIDAGRSYHADAWTWAQRHWPRAFVEVGDSEPIRRLNLAWTVALPVVLVRQPFYPMPAFAELTRAVLAHHPALLSCVVMPDDWQDGLKVHHWRDGQWHQGWPSEELAGADQGWPTREH